MGSVLSLDAGEAEGMTRLARSLHACGDVPGEAEDAGLDGDDLITARTGGVLYGREDDDDVDAADADDVKAASNHVGVTTVEERGDRVPPTKGWIHRPD